MPGRRMESTQKERSETLEKHIERFIRGGLSARDFTDAIYEMLTHDFGLQPGHDKKDFYVSRFEKDPETTAQLLHLCPKKVLNPLCTRIAEAIESTPAKRPSRGVRK